MSDKTLSSRASTVFCIILVICSILIIRIYDLAMYDNTAKQVLSGQYSRKLIVTERTGFVYGSDGKLLSHKENGAFAVINPGGITDKNSAVQYISSYSKLPEDEIIEKISTPTPFVVHLDKVPDENSPSGMYICADYTENDNSICRHILGYRDSDGNGRDGIFRTFGSILNGLSGSISYNYAAAVSGMPIDTDSFTVENKFYTDSSGIVLTLNSHIQSETDRICDDYLDMGAVVISDLQSGEILALSSRPLYDKDNVAKSLYSDKGELINRAFALYTPGSVFKTVVAATALEVDTEFADFKYNCSGKCDVNGKTFKCHKSTGHGVQNLEKAYANSCNTYFINLAEKVGFENICAMCRKMGLGSCYAIDGILVPGAKIPDGSKKYPPAYRANFSFGQGETLTSAIDILNIFSISSTGIKRNFSLVKGIYDGNKNEMTYFSESIPERILSEETVQSLRSMMEACIRYGTGSIISPEVKNAGGKTATAQSGQFRDGKELTHKWFAGIYPIDSPKYAVVILCDGNGPNVLPPAKIFSEVVSVLQPQPKNN